MRAMTTSFLRFLDHTKRRITFGRTPLDEWSARCIDLYLTTHNTHNRQTSMLPTGFEPTISASERPQNYALDRAATGTGDVSTLTSWILVVNLQVEIYNSNCYTSSCATFTPIQTRGSTFCKERLLIREKDQKDAHLSSLITPIKQSSPLFIYIPTNCTKLYFFINNTLKHLYCLNSKLLLRVSVTDWPSSGRYNISLNFSY